jgi:hypothetical protein
MPTQGASLSYTEDELSVQLTKALSSLSIAEDDTIASYLEGLLKEEDIDDEEKREAITEFLSEIIPEDNPSLSRTIDEWIRNWNVLMSQKQELEQVRARQKLMELQAKESAILRQDAGNTLANSDEVKQNQLSEEEKRRREVLLRKFGYLEEEKEDDDDARMDKNMNALKVKQQEEKRRDEMKKKAEMDKQRIKEQKEKEMQLREAERKRTMKKEKRRM